MDGRYAIVILMLVGLLALEVDQPGDPHGAERGLVTIHLVHTNDLHGQVDPLKNRALDERAPPLVGGLEALAATIRAAADGAAGRREPFLWLDAGDFWQGTPEGTLTRGAVMIEWFHDVGLDALALGNHEFDAGADAIAETLAAARFPVLCANIRDERTGEFPAFVAPYADLSVGGLRVAVIGLLTDDMDKVTAKRGTRGFTFLDARATAVREVAAARARGADIVLIVSHCGNEKDKELAQAVEGLDAVIGGHSHMAQRYEDPRTGALAHATYARGTTLGHIRLTFDPRLRRVVRKESWLEDTLVAKHPAGDVRARAILERCRKKLGPQLDEVVGEAAAPLMRSRDPKSTALGSFVADAMREAAGADVALTNKGGLRADLEKGPVRVRDLFGVMPFGNTVVVCELTRAELLEVLEHGVASGPGGLELSGMRVVCDPSRPAGERIVSLELPGRPGEPRAERATFLVATNSFLAEGGDGHKALAAAPRRETGILQLEAAIARLRRLRTIEAHDDGRFRAAAPSPRAPAANPGR